MPPTDMDQLGATYYWKVCVIDGKSWTNKTYHFTTTTLVLEPKWTVQSLLGGASGVLITDVNKDGMEEVIHAGSGRVTCLNGSNGAVIWTKSISGTDYWVQPQMADINKDGVFEVIVPIRSPGGVEVLYANNGSTFWRRIDLGGTMLCSPVATDISGDGYMTIFVATEDVSNGLNGTGRVTSLSYDGKILHQTFAWRPCSGGLSIADTDYDGEFELYMGDRDNNIGDGNYGLGVRSFWAENLTSRWNSPTLLYSSSIPILADVDHDGILDVIAGHLAWAETQGGFAVLNSTDGSFMSKDINRGVPLHYQQSVYDVDGDGNLEALAADGQHDHTANDIVIWDLVNRTIDARLDVGRCFYPRSWLT